MSSEIRRALISWLNYPPETSETLSGLAWRMVREAKKCGAILAPYYVEMASHIEALEYANKQMKLEFQRLAIDIAAEAAVASRAGQMKSLEGLSQFCLSQAKE